MPVPLNPIQAPAAYCLDCSQPLRIEVVKYANGKLQKILYSCDKCRYTVDSSLDHLNGPIVAYKGFKMSDMYSGEVTKKASER